MVLLVELVLAAGILAVVYLLAVGRTRGMLPTEPDVSPGDLGTGPLTAAELVAVRLPTGFGYRKLDVDLLLDRVARQLPQQAAAQVAEQQGAVAELGRESSDG